MGLQLLEREKAVFEEQTAKAKTVESRLAIQQPDFAGHEYLLERQLKPEARYDIVQALRKAGIQPTAMIDISDGLSSEPIDYQTSSLADDFGINPVTAALSGGEDYELLFTVPLKDYDKIREVEDVHVIGNITRPELGNTLVTRAGAEIELKAQGWNAFPDDKQ